MADVPDRMGETTTGASVSRNAVGVRAPARLHFGFLDLHGGLGRRFGSIGLALDTPAIQLKGSQAPRASAAGPEAERVRA